MENIFLFSLFIGGTGFIYIVVKQWLKMSRLPSGPIGWPLVGNFFQMDPEKPHHSWSSLAKKYGDIYTVNNIGIPMVLCNSFQAIHEMLVSKSNEFGGRPEMYAFKYMMDGGQNIVTPDISPQWIHLKKLFMTSLKQYGDGQQHLENIMIDIIDDLVEDIMNHQDQAFDMKEPIELVLANTLTLMSMGDKFKHHDPDFHQLLKIVAQARVIAAPSIFSFALDSWPWLHYFPFPYCKLLDEVLAGFKDWIPRQIEKRKAREDYDGTHPKCALDKFIQQYEEDRQNNSPIAINEKQLAMLVADVFGAGMITSTATLYSMFAVLVARPDIQSRAQKEVDQVLEGNRPTINDRDMMPYCQALLEEVLRNATIVVGVPHKSMVDSTICGHNIPKDTTVFPNIWNLCHDPTSWDDPWEYKPERFLDSEGKKLSVDHPVNKRMLVFGGGRRVCPGQHLARNRIFLITTSLLQKFSFLPAEDDQPPDCDPRSFPFATGLMPKPYQIRAIPRLSSSTHTISNIM